MEPKETQNTQCNPKQNEQNRMYLKLYYKTTEIKTEQY